MEYFNLSLQYSIKIYALDNEQSFQKALFQIKTDDFQFFMATCFLLPTMNSTDTNVGY
jgi:hypothetical protein